MTKLSQRNALWIWVSACLLLMLTACPPAAGEGWRFDHWEGDVTGNAVPANLTMDGDKNVAAETMQ